MHYLQLNHSWCYRMAWEMAGIDNMIGIKVDRIAKFRVNYTGFNHFKQFIGEFQFIRFYFPPVSIPGSP